MKPLQTIIFKFLKDTKLAVLDVFFPINCIGCGIEDVWICDMCIKKIKIRDQQFCPICEKIITPDGQVCFACKKISALTGMLVATSYQESIISKAVHLFKYRFVQELHVQLSEIVSKAIQSYELPLPDLIIPIPLHAKRLRWRGFNQSTLLANDLARKLLPDSQLELRDDILIRNRYTSPQMAIKDHHARNLNIKGAFTVTDKSIIKDKKILLIDDITTTGFTIFECASVLKAAGAKEIYAVVIARQEYKQKS